MSERPPISGIGHIIATRRPRKAYDVRMKNGFVSVGVVKAKGPLPPENLSDADLEAAEVKVTVEYSPFDMSRSKISEFHLIEA
ncbi:hypothetical protein OAE61_05640 [Verrucomicrobiales bacterium]|nr:hypothetical protein [Verrucomicrobiales bacterium]